MVQWRTVGLVLGGSVLLGVIIAAVVLVLAAENGEKSASLPRPTRTAVPARMAPTRSPTVLSEEPAAEPTVEPTASPIATEEPSAATATPSGPPGPEEALRAFLESQQGQAYIGACPQELAGEVPEGLCSVELSRGEDRAAYGIGLPFSEISGEVIVVRQDDGSWVVETVLSAPPGEAELSVGTEAVVYLAGDCLNFREEPSQSAPAVACEADGFRFTVDGGPVEAEGLRWWHAEGLGWAADDYMAPAP